MNPAIARLDAALARHYPEFYAALGPGSSNDELDELEHEYGRPLPPLYREFLAWHGPKTKAEYPRSGYMIGIFELTSARSAISTVKMMRDLRECETGWIESVWWGEFYLPLMQHGGPELCVDIDGEARLEDDDGLLYPSSPGQIIQFNHADELRRIYAPDIATLLTAAAITAERRQFTQETNDWGNGKHIDLIDFNNAVYAAISELEPGFPSLNVMMNMPDDFQ